MPARPSGIRTRRFLESEWLPAIRESVRPSTYRGYEIHVRRHLAPMIGNVALRHLTPTRINDLYREIAARRLSAATVRRIHATLHRALRDAVRWGYLDTNPCDGADPPRARGTCELTTWDSETLRCFLEHARSHEWFALWTLLATTGMRRGEALGLQLSDVDFDHELLAVRRAVVAVGGDVMFSEPKSARGRRVIALDSQTCAVVRDHVARQNGGSLLFAQSDGSPLRPWTVSHEFQRLVIEADLPVIRLHDLRHTHATLALQAGVHPKIVSERLGHATVAMTLDVYSHAIPHLQREAATAIGRLIW